MKNKRNIWLINLISIKQVDPYIAAEEMRLHGNFSRQEFLSGQQISSFFSRLCQQERKSTLEDVEAAEEEDRKDQLKHKVKNILNSL